MRLERIFAGKILLGTAVDVTDPCYDKNVRCRVTLDGLLSGTYLCYAYRGTAGDFANRIWYARIVHEGHAKDPQLLGNPKQNGPWERTANIGVDSGLAGFFDNKPDFVGNQWAELCSWMFRDKKGGGVYLRSFEGRDGFWTSAGEGDGSYDVYIAREPQGKIVAAELCFYVP